MQSCLQCEFNGSSWFYSKLYEFHVSCFVELTFRVDSLFSINLRICFSKSRKPAGRTLFLVNGIQLIPATISLNPTVPERWTANSTLTRRLVGWPSRREAKLKRKCCNAADEKRIVRKGSSISSAIPLSRTTT